jgi:bifunctional ADP-heptose synthase (sugar kinase/adenylyltransferase)
MELANAAAGVVVMESGAAVCSPDSLASALVHAPRSAPTGSSRSAHADVAGPRKGRCG